MLAVFVTLGATHAGIAEVRSPSHAAPINLFTIVQLCDPDQMILHLSGYSLRMYVMSDSLWNS